MNKAVMLFSLASIVLALVVAGIGLRLGFVPDREQESRHPWSSQDQRALANKLKGAGVSLQAIKAYEDYVASGAVDKKTFSSLSYTIGKMYMEAGRYEEALSWLYRVELADPATPLKADVGSKIVNCLERIGKFNAAEYALNKHASRDSKPAGNKGSTVVARIGDEKVYLEEINEALDAMPQWMRKQFQSKEKKVEYLKKYVGDLLFYRKAVKLEYDKDPVVRKQLKVAERDLLVNKVLQEELKDKITIEPDDLQNYFQAHTKEYEEKEAVSVSLIKAGMKEIADRIKEELSKGKSFSDLAREISLDEATAKNGGKFNGWVRNGEDDLGIGNVDEVSRVLFAGNKTEITPAVEAGGYYYIFKIEDTRPAKMPDFTEVAERVKNDYYMQKLKISYQNLMDQILKTSEVKLFPEAITGEGS